MWKDKSPGVKILWLWTIGTAAVLVTSAVRTRLKDMEKLMNAEEETIRPRSTLTGESADSVRVIKENDS